MKPIETSFKRIETKYVVTKADLANLIEDLKIYLVEDDYPTSTISNIYFDTEQFDMIQEDDQGTKRKEKIRMRTYLSQVQPYSQGQNWCRTKISSLVDSPVYHPVYDQRTAG